VRPGVVEGDLGSGIPLGGDDVLTAAEIFVANADEPRLPFPARALLAACASGGAAGAGRGEWLGLGGALLAAGTRQLVATAWPVWDSPESAAFEHSLAEMLVSSGNVARGLRDAQLQRLMRWRLSVPHTEEALAHAPIGWAAYQFLGVRW
jgi:CHAT domain-containing protein